MLTNINSYKYKYDQMESLMPHALLNTVRTDNTQPTGTLGVPTVPTATPWECPQCPQQTVGVPTLSRAPHDACCRSPAKKYPPIFPSLIADNYASRPPPFRCTDAASARRNSGVWDVWVCVLSVGACVCVECV